jgi:hypothetical protein
VTYLNEYEAEETARFIEAARLDNLIVGSRVLLALIEWANDNSDGWTYWRKPRQAATKLVEMIEDRRRNHLKANGLLDCTDAELRQALVPIKTFLTKQGVDYYAELPWAVILPQRVDA